MATLKYEKIFNLFLGSVRDYEFASLDEISRNECLVEWLHDSVANTYVNHIFGAIELDDDLQTITYELERPSKNENIDTDYICSILAKQMVFQWLSPKLNTTTSLDQAFLTGSDSKFYAQANHIQSMLDVSEKADIEVRRLIRDRGYISNSYLDGGN